ncbi:hypothetical protein KGM_205822 [Danaus plexippus plexippus]|uniref:non-specific serine/threonine protein kinase n=1 Tax=Danaus plexippus plexippus TaxID=278856 RepID=A0A212FFT4_DANPL|nr:hypothetical protein KGM_205822 [Danaus plexippus plexippus]
MSEKLKDYQVLDVFCDGSYKVRHKVTNSIHLWKAYNCSSFSDEQLQNVDNEVKILSKGLSGNFLRYYDTILHGPTKTLYFVLEYNSWQSLEELIAQCKTHNKHFAESFIWYLLLELARLCKTVETLNFVALKKSIKPTSIFVSEDGDLRINCFELFEESLGSNLMQEIGEVIRTLCYLPGATDYKIREFRYSDDLQDVISFITDDKNANLRPDVVLYHPTVLTNTESVTGLTLKSILMSNEVSGKVSEGNKCDSEKAVEQMRMVEPLPRSHFNGNVSPMYCNLSPKWKLNTDSAGGKSPIMSPMSPTIAALALELPGFVPRCRKPYTEALEMYNVPRKVSEETLSQQWMSRLIALRQREESLNVRERNLIAKEIVNSPSIEMAGHEDSEEECHMESNGITLPPLFTQANGDRNQRRQKRSCSVRTRSRRKSYAYEDLDSSLSADPGDSSIIITAAKITKDNMPHRNIFPETSSKKVHFTSSNPFVESDDSVTLTFYELENVNPGLSKTKPKEKILDDITKFKYLDLEKITSEKRAALQWNHSSPSKQAKVSGKVFSDITNKGLRKTPSRSSVTSKSSVVCRSAVSKNQWCGESKVSPESMETLSDHKMQLSLTPKAPPDIKKSRRKSLLPFKTPFKFKTSTKV